MPSEKDKFMWLKSIKTILNNVEIERVKLNCFQILGQGVQISVSEINCPEPDCPPVKTAILLFKEGQPTQSIFVHKPARDIKMTDLQMALNPLLKKKA